MTARIRLIETPGRIAAKVERARDRVREWWGEYGHEVRYFLGGLLDFTMLVGLIAIFIYSAAC